MNLSIEGMNCHFWPVLWNGLQKMQECGIIEFILSWIEFKKLQKNNVATPIKMIED